MDEEVRYWFGATIKQPAESRTAFLAVNCRDGRIRGEVQSLLDHDCEEADGAEDLEVPPSLRGPIEALRAGHGVVPLPERVGAFQIERLLGSGGMGLVYEGRRVDGEVRQRVAIKFAQLPGALSAVVRESVQRRFHRERQLLAQLRHPYIAGLIDAGTTADGIPYAVMEQVDGVPIDEYCVRERLDRSERIRLVLKLCDAVQFAHSQLIVHADIKPENVLVTRDGIPKLIDFGLSTCLAGDPTVTTSRAFTPGYASPEQYCGQPVSAATDVYGMGAVLYRLLTGAKPREMKARSVDDVLKSICDDDDLRPSHILPELKGDLENILLKALESEPRRRYESVTELSADLRSFLSCRPVRATPASPFYRLRRFLQRHWAPAFVLAVLFAGLSGLTIFSIHQRAAAMQQAAETRRLAQTLLFDVHDGIEGMVGGTKAREKLGTLAVQYLEGLEQASGADPELSWELLNAYARLAQSRGGAVSSIGDTASGLQCARKTLELGAMVESGQLDLQRRDRLFAIYESLVLIFEDGSAAKERWDTIGRMLKLASELDPVRKAQAEKQWARYLDATGRSEEAVRVFTLAIDGLRRSGAGRAGTADAGVELSSNMVALGRAMAANGDFSGAVDQLNEAIRVAGASVKAEPHSQRNARQLYWGHLILGDILGSPLRFNLGRPKQALEHYHQARQIAERLLSGDPGNDVAKVDLVRVLGRAGVALAAVDAEGALALLERSEMLARTTSSRNQLGLDYRLAYLTSSVTALVRVGRLDRAERNIAEARRLLVKMREAGMETDEKSVLRAEAIVLHAAGKTRDAMAVAARQIALVPEGPSPVLSQNFDRLEPLERMREYASGVDPALCASAAQRIRSIWRNLESTHPHSTFIRLRAEAAKASSCDAPLEQVASLSTAP